MNVQIDFSVERSFMASHFYKFIVGSGMLASSYDLEEILCDNSRKLKDENLLIDLTRYLCKNAERCSVLLRCVRLYFVSFDHF